MNKGWLEDSDLDTLEFLVYYVFYFCISNNMPIEEELTLKARYNKSRPYRHGNKVL